MVYHGVAQGITAYHDGAEVGTKTEKAFYGDKSNGNGQVLIGKRYGGPHISISVDEIKFYNRQLSEQEIGNMYRRF